MSNSDEKLDSYLKGVDGASDGSGLGELGYMKYQSDRRRSHNKYLETTTVNEEPSRVADSNNSWSLWGKNKTVGSDTKSYLVSSLDELFSSYEQLSDRIFEPLEAKFSNKAVGVILTIGAIIGTIVALIIPEKFHWVYLPIGTFSGMIAPYVVYQIVRWVIGPVVVIALGVGLVLAIFSAVIVVA